MISWKGPGRLVRIEGNLNAEGYIALLEEHLFASVQEMGLGPRWIFQQVVQFHSFSISYITKFVLEHFRMAHLAIPQKKSWIGSRKMMSMS